jgi:acyl-CoA dehydrogenase
VTDLSDPAITSHTVYALVEEWLGKNPDVIDATYAGPTTPIVAASLRAEVPWLQTLWDHGWTRWGWPASLGGLGGGPRIRAMIYDAFWSLGYQLPERLSVLETLGPALERYGPTWAQDDLPRLLTGRQMWGQCFSEPEAGSDLASIRTSARRDGDTFVVNGQKIWSSFWHVADRAVLLARTGPSDSGHRGLTMFWVDLDVPGVTRRPIRQAGGRDEFSEIFYDDVRVPADRLLGEIDGGWAVAMYILQFERGMYSWWRQTIMNHRLDCARRETEDATDSDAITTAAQTYRLLSVLRSRAAHTVEQLEAGETVGPQTSIDKVLLSWAERSLADLERMVNYPDFEYGDDDHATHLRQDWFHSRAVSIYGGALEIQLDIIADRLLGMPKEPRRGR